MSLKNGCANQAIDNVPRPVEEEKIINHLSLRFSIRVSLTVFIIEINEFFSLFK